MRRNNVSIKIAHVCENDSVLIYSPSVRTKILQCRATSPKGINSRGSKECKLKRNCLLSCCLTSTEARWPIRDGDRVGKGTSERVIGSTAETARKRPERPWTATRTMKVLRRCPLAIAQRLGHCAIAVSTAVLDRVTKTMSVAPLLANNLDNSKQKTSNLLSPAPPPCS